MWTIEEIKELSDQVSKIFPDIRVEDIDAMIIRDSVRLISLLVDKINEDR